ncbi:hypothetical protein PHLGIDRAFT_348561 [Phlebiopsis gigantea 11061_1 CR5-6]|uniref:Uncharacterized protein n=1 Tax=Phlebiopsis gigantea (strain 11061_1 CR5-6) TaxID=745531 RepID=A0A0C3NAM7_PHLG1|nr:hypothetical protein PHLGIDRAFT_348561 [Phlebiopsis gigantea 11061_1 CR5-6]
MSPSRSPGVGLTLSSHPRCAQHRLQAQRPDLRRRGIVGAVLDADYRSPASIRTRNCQRLTAWAVLVFSVSQFPLFACPIFRIPRRRRQRPRRTSKTSFVCVRHRSANTLASSLACCPPSGSLRQSRPSDRRASDGLPASRHSTRIVRHA